MYVISTTTGEVIVDAEEHAVEGLFHVFRSTATVMGNPRTVVVRRLPVDAVTAVTRR